MPAPNGSYTLTEVNGKAAPERIHIELSGSGPVRFHGKVTNILNGELEYKTGELKGMLIGTLMLGPPERMEVERILGRGLVEGMRVKQNGSTLTMTHGDDTLVFTK